MPFSMPIAMLSAEITDVVSEAVPDSTKMTFMRLISIVFNTKFYHALFLLVLMGIFLKILDHVFKPLRQKNQIHIVFIHAVLRVLIVVTFLLRIGALSDTLAKFYESILMSSSLIVVVLGFVFQEGLSNVIHGFMLIISKPFKLGDRVKITIDGQVITGYVKDISIRSTIVQTVTNNSMMIIPNAKMDMCLIDNSYLDPNSVATNFMDITITYESDFDRAIEIISEVISSHPLVRAARPAAEKDKPVNVLVSDLAASHILLRASVTTHTTEENFQACSDIRKEILHRFREDPAVDFAYPHMHLVQ